MKAAVYEKYGPPEVLEVKEVERPVPGDNEVLIRVRATTVTPMDWRFRNGKTLIARFMTGLRRPKNRILGVELAGEIEAVGRNVGLLHPGDRVFGGVGPGAHAEYVCAAEDKVAVKPANMTFEEAAAVSFAGGTALRFLRDYGHLRSGQRVLINGASGGVGTFAVQLAKAFGAEVTGVCSTQNLELVRSLGADTVLDYTVEDFAKTGQTYDVIFDAVGKRTFSECRGSLNQKGVYVSTVATIPLLLQVLGTSMVGGKKARFGMPPLTKEDLIFLKDLIEAGKMRTVIDRRYPLSEIAEAHRYVEKGHSKGKVIVTIEG